MSVGLEEVRDALKRWTARGERAALATLVDARRSAPRPPGARFAVSAAGEMAGSVSSGCVEGDLFERLRAVLAGDPADVVRYGITDEMAAGVGLSCGGEIDVLVEPHDAGDPVWSSLESAVDAGRPAVLVTGLGGPVRSRRLLVLEDARVGGLGDAGLDDRAAALATGLLGRSGTRRGPLVEEDPATDVFAEAFSPPPRLAIIGATPIAEALCEFAARCGFEVHIIDPREAFARPDRFPAAREVIVRWPDEALAAIGADASTCVVVLTHDAKLDRPALEAALRAGCRYVGLLGGRRTQALRRESLIEAGFDPETVARVRGPVGLDIGARTPPEIAVSILAEIIGSESGP